MLLNVTSSLWWIRLTGLISAMLVTSAAATSCGSDEDTCADGQCVISYSHCDGVQDCSDGNDESATFCPNGTLPPFQTNYLMVVDQSRPYINLIQIDTGEVRRLLNSPDMVADNSQYDLRIYAAVADPTTKNIYFTRPSNNTINVLDWTTMTVSVLGHIGESGIEYMDLDPTSRNIYYVDYTNDSIGVFNIDTFSNTIIWQNSSLSTSDIQYEETNNEIYWYSGGAGGGIYKCSVGNCISTVTSVVLGIDAYTFAIDKTESKLYWISYQHNLIETANLDGTGRQVLKHMTLYYDYVYDMTLTSNFIYMVQDNNRGVVGCDRHTFDCHVATTRQFSDPRGVSQIIQIPDTQLCMVDYVHCAGIGCVYIHHICDGVNDCADGSDEVAPLCPGGRKEYLWDRYIVVSDEFHGTLYQVDPLSGGVIHISEANQSFASESIAINPENGDIYAVSSIYQTIARLTWSTKQTDIIFYADDYLSCGGLAIDAERNLLYVVNRYYKGWLKEISASDGTVVRTLLEGVGSNWIAICCGLAFNPDSRMLYYPNQDYQFLGINTLAISDSEISNATLLFPTGQNVPDVFAVDFNSNKTYFTSRSRRQMIWCDLNGANNGSAADEYPGNYNAQTLDDEYVYVTDTQFAGIRRFNRVTHQWDLFTDQHFALLTGIAYFKTDKTTVMPSTQESTTVKQTTDALTTQASTKNPFVSSKSSTVEKFTSPTLQKVTTEQNTQRQQSSSPVIELSTQSKVQQESTTQAGGPQGSTTQAVGPQGPTTKTGGPLEPTTQEEGTQGSTTQAGGPQGPSTLSGGSQESTVGGLIVNTGGFNKIMIIIISVVCAAAAAVCSCGLCLDVVPVGPDDQFNRRLYNN